jgi:hypothetical protein
MGLNEITVVTIHAIVIIGGGAGNGSTSAVASIRGVTFGRAAEFFGPVEARNSTTNIEIVELGGGKVYGLGGPGTGIVGG